MFLYFYQRSLLTAIFYFDFLTCVSTLIKKVFFVQDVCDTLRFKLNHVLFDRIDNDGMHK